MLLFSQQVLLSTYHSEPILWLELPERFQALPRLMRVFLTLASIIQAASHSSDRRSRQPCLLRLWPHGLFFQASSMSEEKPLLASKGLQE